MLSLTMVPSDAEGLRRRRGPLARPRRPARQRPGVDWLAMTLPTDTDRISSPACVVINSPPPQKIHLINETSDFIRHDKFFNTTYDFVEKDTFV